MKGLFLLEIGLVFLFSGMAYALSIELDRVFHSDPSPPWIHGTAYANDGTLWVADAQHYTCSNTTQTNQTELPYLPFPTSVLRGLHLAVLLPLVGAIHKADHLVVQPFRYVLPCLIRWGACPFYDVKKSLTVHRPALRWNARCL